MSTVTRLNHSGAQSAETATSQIISHRIGLILKSAAGLGAVGVLSLYAFSFMFTSFGPFDDEGYFLQACRDFLSGRAAYDQVFSFYGPFTFYSGAVISRFNPSNATHDNFRWAFLVLWIVIALLLAGIVWRWAGRFSPALIAFFLIGFRLLGLAVSVGHPQVWVILIAGLLLWLGIDWVHRPPQRGRAFAAGALLALVFLCKINIGVFISVAIALAGSLLLRGRLRTVASALFLILAVALGLTVFLAGSTSSEKCFACVYLVSLVGTVSIAIRRPSEQKPAVRNLFWLAVGFGACIFAGLGLVLLYGTTFRGLINSLIVYPALLARSYHQPYLGATKSVSIILFIAGFCAAIFARYIHRLGERAQVLLSLIKLVAGACLLFAFIRWPQEALIGSFPFLWLLLVSDPPFLQRQYTNRLLLVVMSFLFSLQLFPVAGTQLVWAELLPIVGAALLVADGANSLELYTGKGMPRPVRVAAIWIGPLFAALLFVPCGKAAFTRYRQWRSTQSLGLPGAHWLRLPPPEAARLIVPVNELRRQCNAVLILPGLYSYSIWSGVPPIEEKRINSWPFLWPDEVIRRDLPKLREQDRGCVLLDSDQYRFFKSIAVTRGNDELLSEIQRTMTPVFAFKDITLYKAAGQGSTQGESGIPR